jgi:hypothetical protein
MDLLLMAACLGNQEIIKVCNTILTRCSGLQYSFSVKTRFACKVIEKNIKKILEVIKNRHGSLAAKRTMEYLEAGKRLLLS